MSTEHVPREKANLPRSGDFRWRVAAIVLPALVVVIAAWIVATNVFPISDPTKREVTRIMDRVRKEERGQRPWQEILEAIRERLFRRDTTAQSAPSASEELEKLGEQAHPFLIPLVNSDRSPAVRQLAIEILERGYATNAFAVVAQALATDSVTGVRAAAASAVSELDPNAAEPLLLAALEREKRELEDPKGPASDAWTQSRAMDAIARALGSLGATNALGSLLDVLKINVSSNVRSSIADALGALGDPRAAPALRSLIATNDFDVRRSAISALGQLRDRDSVSLLMGLMEEGVTNAQASATAASGGRSASQSSGEWQNARQTLAEALGRIGDKRATPMLVRAVTNVVEEYELQMFIEAFAALGDPRAIPALQGMMADNPKLAKEAAEALVSLGHESVTRDLTALLEAPEREKRVAGAMALANLGNTSVLTNLVQTLATGAGSDNAKNVVEALGIIGDATTVPPLVTALKDADEDVRAQAAWSLGNIGEPSAAAPLIQSLADTNFYVRFAAAFALIGMTNPAGPLALETLFNDPEPRVRTAAATSMAFHGATRAIPQLAATLKRSDDWQRLAAAMSLLRLNTPESRELVQGLSNDRNAGLRELARLGLERGPVAALTNMLAQGTDDHRHYAARMLLFFNEPAAIPALRQALRDPRADVRVASRITLRRLEQHASSRVEVPFSEVRVR